MKAGLSIKVTSTVSNKKKSYLKLILLLLSFIVTNNISENLYAQDFGTHLKSSYLDYLGSFTNRNIVRVDIDNNGSEEIISIVSDSIIICYNDSINYFKAFGPDITNQIRNWEMSYCKGGSLEGYIFTSGLSASALTQFEWSLFNPLSGDRIYGNLPSWEIETTASHPEGTVWFTQHDIDSLMIQRTTNFNNGSEHIVNIGDGDSLISFSPGRAFYSYTPIYTSFDGRYISTITLSDDFFTSGNPGGVYHYFSTDFGSTWQGKIIARGSMNNPEFGQVTNRNIAPYFSPFSEFSGVVDDNGVLHLAVFGYGCSIEGTDTVEYTPILYWNSRDDNWIAISDPAYELGQDAAGNILGLYYPGYSYGQSLPSISVSRNGEAVLVGWVSPEYTGTPGNLVLNIYPGDGGTFSQPIYYTDLLTNISLDGGVTWSNQNITSLKNYSNTSEEYISFTDYLNYYSNGAVKAEYIYLIDSIPGLSTFNQNGLGKLNPYYYDSYIYGEVPVELISFSAEVVNNVVNLKWSTASELNNRGFEVERKQVGSNQYAVGNEEWNTIGFVEGNGTQSQSHHYIFIDSSVTAGKYSYRLKQIDFDGSFTYSNIVEVDLSLPLTFSLDQNFPNPFNPTTKIRYTVASNVNGQMSNVLLKVHDILGREIATLVNEVKPAGSYELLFDASNLASGVYFYSLQAGEFKMTKKMLMIK